MEQVTYGGLSMGLPQQSIWQRILGFLIERDSAFRQTHALGQLDDHLLRDIGLTSGHTVARDSHAATFLRS